MHNKPIANSGVNYNINDLDHRRFEELLHRIFDYRINDDLKGIFDEAFLMAGVGEEGRDVILQFNGKKKGVIQCKKYEKNIDKPTVAKEIIKFVLYYYKNNSLIDDLSDFTYYLVCSYKFANTSIDLLTDFKTNILNEKDLSKWIESVIKSKDNKSLNDLKYLEIEADIKAILADLNVKAESYSEINGWLSQYSKIVDEFFEIKKVVDNSSIEKIVEILNPDLERKAKKLKTDYYKVAKKHLDIVKFIGHSIPSGSRPRNITTSKLYVEPSITIQQKKIDQKSPEKIVKRKDKLLKMHDVFKRSKHYIVLGDPGAGKSLMVKHLILRLMKGNSKTGGLKNYQSHIPFRIELRKYNKEKLKNNFNILSYLVSILKEEYQLTYVDLDILKYIIENQSTLFFFDGLDEVFDTVQKNAICEDITNFTLNNKKMKSLVTSRFVGYEEDLFNEEMFETFEIKNFNEKQIDDFIKKFYSVQISNIHERKVEIKNCKKQLSSVDDSLKSNPLILSLMSLLAINKIVIPDSKLDVYRSCTNTLVETRDKNEKGLEFNLKIKSPRGAFGELGFWQYCSMTDKNQVSKKLAEKTITDYLLKNEKIANILEAEEISQEFLEYAEKRSIYFDDNFMHKTFLEYYTADYIYTRFHSTFKLEERDSILEKYIENSQWHIIFELLIGMIDEQNVESTPLDILITNQLDKDEYKVEKNYFFLSILSKIDNIGEDVKKRVIYNSIILTLDNLKSKEFDFFSLIQINAQIKILQPIIQEILYEIEKTIDEKKLINFYNFYYELNKESLWVQETYKYLILNLKEIKKLKNININLFNNYYLNNFNESIDRKKIIECINYFGKESIFRTVRFIYNNGGWIDLFSIYLKDLDFTSMKTIEDELSYLKLHGLTINIIKENYRTRFIPFIFQDEENKNSLVHIVKLYIQSKNKKVNEFIEILLRDIDKRTIKDIHEEFKDNLNYQNLIKNNKPSI